ncbi:unnamed protein product [Cuscuta epithymum]|uniref:Transmembrane protein n=1 Tax=Cuscuta epithymum TaxID=186058 RepID=A0AAV0G1U5_9ASTE|nr:unnamed protein product [Cuscuta epithymum]
MGAIVEDEELEKKLHTLKIIRSTMKKRRWTTRKVPPAPVKILQIRSFSTPPPPLFSLLSFSSMAALFSFCYSATSFIRLCYVIFFFSSALFLLLGARDSTLFGF